MISDAYDKDSYCSVKLKTIKLLREIMGGGLELNLIQSRAHDLLNRIAVKEMMSEFTKK